MSNIQFSLMNFRFLIVAAVLSLCNIAAYGQGKALSKASKFYKEKQYHEAIPFFKEAVAENASLAVKMKLANCYKQTNQYDEAEKVYAEIVFDDKAKPIAYKYYAQSLMGNGEICRREVLGGGVFKEKTRRRTGAAVTHGLQ